MKKLLLKCLTCLNYIYSFFLPKHTHTKKKNNHRKWNNATTTKKGRIEILYFYEYHLFLHIFLPIDFNWIGPEGMAWTYVREGSG